MGWENLFKMGKSFVSLFTGELVLYLRDITNKATWTNPNISCFASSISTKNKAFIFDTQHSLNGDLAKWSSIGTLCRDVRVSNHRLFYKANGAISRNPYVYYAYNKDVHGTVILHFKAVVDNYNEVGMKHQFGFNLYLNNSLYATLKTTHDIYAHTMKVVDSKNIFDFVATNYYINENTAVDCEYYVVVNILDLTERYSSLEIRVDDFYFNTDHGRISYTFTADLESCLFYDIQNTTRQQAQCLAVAFERY